MEKVKYYYNAVDNEFYTSFDVSTHIGKDYIEITEKTYDECCFPQEGYICVSNKNGEPFLIEKDTYLYSAKNNAFYPYAIQTNYLNSDSWPNDGVNVSGAVYREFAIELPPKDKVRGSNKKGYPCWVNTPVMPKEQLMENLEQEKKVLLNEASEAIAPLQYAVDLDMATDEEIVRLKEWKKYSVLLNRIDTSTAPDIEWPVKP
ncbi:tail fiber assembly protein [Providencia huaxiensis]|uniref:tail fiber assembly protein n=1 Tax=Providencia huaxiensis TaxID=2027290 RepID=UPI003D282F4A